VAALSTLYSTLTITDTHAARRLLCVVSAGIKTAGAHLHGAPEEQGVVNPTTPFVGDGLSKGESVWRVTSTIVVGCQSLHVLASSLIPF
jgi:hypothetical protein